MATIGETVQYIRSKNAGPFWMTIDLFCDSEVNFQKLTQSPHLNTDTVARIFDISAESVSMFFLPALKVVKISFPRKVVQGSPNDSDMHGGQQYIPLLSVEL